MNLHQPVTVPATMKAAALDHFGGPEVLALQTVPVPQPGPDDVLIAVDVAGVGGWDADMREGWSPDGRRSLPLVLGTDGSGTIAALGANVRRFSVGDRVYAYHWDTSRGGFYAEYVAVPGEVVAYIPKSLDPERAGAVPVTGLTALQGIDNALRLKRGETLLVHGAAGGVGTLAVQFAKLRGARVLASASHSDSLLALERLGVDAVVNGRSEELARVAREFAPKGLDAVLALTGNGLEQCYLALRKGGRLAYPHGIEPEPKRRLGITVIGYDAAAGIREFERLRHAIEAMPLQVPIAAQFPLAQAAAAHQRLAQGDVIGKIVLRIH